MITLPNVTKKNTTGYRLKIITLTRISSTIKGKIWNRAILRIVLKDCEPRETVLITLPVSRERWKASDWFYMCWYTI